MTQISYRSEIRTDMTARREQDHCLSIPLIFVSGKQDSIFSDAARIFQNGIRIVSNSSDIERIGPNLNLDGSISTFSHEYPQGVTFHGFIVCHERNDSVDLRRVTELWPNNSGAKRFDHEPARIRFGWVDQVKNLDLQSKHRDARRLLFKHAEELLIAREWAALGSLIQEIPWEGFSPEVKVGLLRTTYRAKTELGRVWSVLYRRVRSSLVLRGYEKSAIEDMLQGLAIDGT